MIFCNKINIIQINAIIFKKYDGKIVKGYNGYTPVS